MDVFCAVKNSLECINFHWIIVVCTGLYMHLREICLIGLCFEVVKDPPFDPSYASILFVFSTLCLLAEYRLWPKSLKEPPIQLLVIYEMLFSALVTDLATRIIWIPLMHLTFCVTQESSKALIWINTQMELGKYSQLITVASYMESTAAATHTAFCIAVLAFLWMLDATETLDSLLIDLWAKFEKHVKHMSLPPTKKITFKNPEVSGWFIYHLPKTRDIQFLK